MSWYYTENNHRIWEGNNGVYWEFFNCFRDTVPFIAWHAWDDIKYSNWLERPVGINQLGHGETTVSRQRLLADPETFIITLLL